MTRKLILLLAASPLLIFFPGFDADYGVPAGYPGIPRAAVAATNGAVSMAGVKVTAPVPSAATPLRDIRSNAPSRQQRPPRDRAVPFRKIRKPGDTTPFTPQLSLSLSPVVLNLFAPAPLAPALDASFEGLGNPTSGDVIPPDTMGAAGPNHLVTLMNSDFGVFDKAGAKLEQVTLDGFWSALGAPADNSFDPKVLYDQHSGRFIALTLGVNGTDGKGSWLLLGVTQTSDPTGIWNMVAIDADLDNNAQQFTNEADFPGLGVDGSFIYVTANMFSPSNIYQYSKAWAIPKAQMLGGSPPGQLEFYEFRDPPGSDSTMQPAHTFGATPGGVGFIVFEGGNGRIHLAGIAPGTPPTWVDLGNVSVTPFISTSLDLPGVPQLGNPNTIDPGDTRLLNAVYRNGSVWTTHHVAGAGGKIEVAWYRIDPGTLTATDQGRISHASRWFVYPSIAVNGNGDVAIGFSGSSSTEYISGYYTARRSGDAAGTMQPVTLLKSGESDYYKTLGGADNRWGDYSATTVDPIDDVSFWTIQEYAKPHVADPHTGLPKAMWGTWWGKFHTAAINSPVLAIPTVVSDSRIDLSWTDPSNNEDGFRVERRLHPAGDFALIDTLDAGSTSYIDNNGLTANSTYYYRVQAFNATGGSYSNDVSASTTPLPAAPSGGGGGGGCAIAGATIRDDIYSPAGTLAIQFLPLAYLAWRRRTVRGQHGGRRRQCP